MQTFEYSPITANSTDPHDRDPAGLPGGQAPVGRSDTDIHNPAEYGVLTLLQKVKS
jgi:hypothetical protein